MILDLVDRIESYREADLPIPADLVLECLEAGISLEELEFTDAEE